MGRRVNTTTTECGLPKRILLSLVSDQSRHTKGKSRFL